MVIHKLINGIRILVNFSKVFLVVAVFIDIGEIVGIITLAFCVLFHFLFEKIKNYFILISYRKGKIKVNPNFGEVPFRLYQIELRITSIHFIATILLGVIIYAITGKF